MRLVTFAASGADHYGVQSGDAFVDLAAALHRLRAVADRPVPESRVQFLETGDWGLRSAAEAVEAAVRVGPAALSPSGQRLIYAASEVRLLAPIPRPPKIVAIGRNYRDHASEASVKLPELPKLFPKFPCTVVGPHVPVIHPPNTSALDYEAEFAVVIGRLARSVSRETAMDYVAGYTILNDISARDIQFKDEQITLGKNYRTFTPMGPCIVTKDELPDPANVDVKLWLNGQLMQDSNTRYLIFDVPYLVSFISGVLDLEPGDVISTGTPAGVGCFRKPPVYLKAGDEIRIELSAIGTLINPVVAA
jgi:acylpyruvate hydrolase